LVDLAKQDKGPKIKEEVLREEATTTPIKIEDAKPAVVAKAKKEKTKGVT